MSIFQKAENEAAYLKQGMLGFQSSGKTFTAMLVAIGLHRYIKSKHPVFFFDSELGSSYIKNKFDDAGIDMQRVQSRAFLTLITAAKEVPEGAIFIIDSITHPWRDLMQSFMKKRGITRIKMNHWAQLKQEWGVFNDFYLNSKVHIIMCGRAGFEFDFEEDEEGNKDLIKTGVKMKTEGELGFEPSLLVELTQEKKMKNGKIVGVTNKAFIIKDRFDIMNGQSFEDPTFETFLPHIQALNLGGNHKPLNDEDSQALFDSDNSVSKRLRQRDIYVEELKNELTLKFNTRSDVGKTEALNFLKETFGTTSMKAIESKQNDVIKEGIVKLQDYKPKEVQEEPKK